MSHPTRPMKDRTQSRHGDIYASIQHFSALFLIFCLLKRGIPHRPLLRTCCLRLMSSRPPEMRCASSKSCSVSLPEEGRSTKGFMNVLTRVKGKIFFNSIVLRALSFRRVPQLLILLFPYLDTTFVSTRLSFTFTVRPLTTRSPTPPSSGSSCCHTRTRDRCSLW